MSQKTMERWDSELVPGASGRTRQPENDCPVEVALAAIAGRWTTLILRDLMHGARSYGRLRTGLPELSDKVLSERLTRLRDRGLVQRDLRPGFPPRSIYSLTPAGHQLRPLLIELYRTGEALQDTANH